MDQPHTTSIDNSVYAHLLRTDANENATFHNNMMNKTVYFFALVVGVLLFICLAMFVNEFIKHG